MWCFLLKNLSEARILDLPPKRDYGHPRLFYFGVLPPPPTTRAFSYFVSLLIEITKNVIHNDFYRKQLQALSKGLRPACEQNGTTPSESVVEVFSWYSNHMEIVFLTNKNWATAINTLLLFLKCALQGFYV